MSNPAVTNSAAPESIFRDTPKSLNEAIRKGLSNASEGELDCGCRHCELMRAAIHKSAMEYLAQVFGDAMTADSASIEAIRAVWKRIRGES